MKTEAVNRSRSNLRVSDSKAIEENRRESRTEKPTVPPLWNSAASGNSTRAQVLRKCRIESRISETFHFYWLVCRLLSICHLLRVAKDLRRPPS